MNTRNLRTVTVIMLLIGLFVLTVSLAYAAGGRIEGKVTDPKGAVVVGAKITVIDPTTSQTVTATTDGQGHYQVAVSAGTYVVVISAAGFTEVRREPVTVQ